MTKSISISLLLILCSAATVAQEEPRSAVVKKKAQEIGEALKQDDYVGYDLRLMSSVDDVGGIPKVGKRLIIVAAVKAELYFRIFGGDGQMVMDTDETKLTTIAGPIEELRKQRESLWPPHKLTESERAWVILAVRLIADYARNAKVVDLTYPKVVELMGGREKMIGALTDGMKQLKEKGFSFRSVEVGEPAEFVEGEKDTFVVVPTTTEMTAPGGKIVVKSYLLGISSDGGKAWTFVDGNGIGTVERREKILPKLPEKLKLPEPHDPEFIKEG